MSDWMPAHERLVELVSDAKRERTPKAWERVLNQCDRLEDLAPSDWSGSAARTQVLSVRRMVAREQVKA